MEKRLTVLLEASCYSWCAGKVRRGLGSQWACKVGRNAANKCHVVVVEEEKVTVRDQKTKDKKSKHKTLTQPLKVEGHACVCQDCRTLGQLQSKMLMEDRQWLYGYSEILHRRKLSCHHRTQKAVNYWSQWIWQILWLKTFNGHWYQIPASKSEGNGQPEDVWVVFEEQSAGQNVMHEN